MNATRKSILAYLEPGQASFAALVAAVKRPPDKIRAEIQALLSEGTIITDTITATLKDRPRFQVTVYLMAPKKS